MTVTTTLHLPALISWKTRQSSCTSWTFHSIWPGFSTIPWVSSWPLTASSTHCSTHQQLKSTVLTYSDSIGTILPGWTLRPFSSLVSHITLSCYYYSLHISNVALRILLVYPYFLSVRKDLVDPLQLINQLSISIYL